MAGFSQGFSRGFDIRVDQGSAGGSLGGVGHYRFELEEARRLAAITKRGPPGFVDLRSAPTFAPFGGPPAAPAMPGPDPGMIAQQRPTAQMQAAQDARKRRREVEAILLLAA